METGGSFDVARRLQRQADKVRVVASALVWRGLCSQDVLIEIKDGYRWLFYDREKVPFEFLKAENACNSGVENAGNCPETRMQPPSGKVLSVVIGYRSRTPRYII